MPDASFDIVSKVDRQEVDNAVNQAAREVAARFDFKGTGAGIAWAGPEVVLRASSPERVTAVLDVFQEKLVKRGVSLKAVTPSEPAASGKEFRITVTLDEGISAEHAKRLVRIIRDEGPKGLTTAIQGDQLRVTGKKRDDLQAVIALVRDKELDFAVQFTNYR